MPVQDKISVIIADDEPPARRRLHDLIEDVGNITVLAEAQNGVEALQAIETHQPDIILLDIRMPVMDGIETAQHIQALDKPPHIIFTTAYDNYAIQAFELNAIDYLLKPIRAERLGLAITKARKFKPAEITAIKHMNSTRTHLSINERGKVHLIPIHDLIYLRAELKYITLRTREREYLYEASLNQLEEELGDAFVRLHRNCLVAKAFITGFEKQSQTNDEGKVEQRWIARLTGIPDTVTISRRHQHLIKSL